MININNHRTKTKDSTILASNIYDSSIILFPHPKNITADNTIHKKIVKQ